MTQPKLPKLVRDLTPRRIIQSGAVPLINYASEETMEDFLRQKLQEEVAEYLVSGDMEELADILEVVYALARNWGFSAEDLDRTRERKATTHGRFALGVLWYGNQESASEDALEAVSSIPVVGTLGTEQ